MPQVEQWEVVRVTEGSTWYELRRGMSRWMQDGVVVQYCSKRRALRKRDKLRRRELDVANRTETVI